MGRRCQAAATYPEDPRASSRPLRLGLPGLMVDYQFLGRVAVALAVVTRGKVLPVLAMTAVIALVTVVYEAGARHLRRRHARPAASGDSGSALSDGELTSWMPVMDRVIRSND